jgi:hypothetical protein
VAGRQFAATGGGLNQSLKMRAFLKSPINSFFLVSTEMTGSPAVLKSYSMILIPVFRQSPCSVARRGKCWHCPTCGVLSARQAWYGDLATALALALAGGMIATPAFAADSSVEMMKMMYTNKNGLIEKDEYIAYHSKMFDKMAGTKG